MIDSTLFGASIPAGSYTAGDEIQLSCIDGPSTVRSGRGTALLKRITSGLVIGNTATGGVSYWLVSVKNSDWIDPAGSSVTPLDNPTALDLQSGSVQDGQNCPLTPNSSWIVTAKCLTTITTTVDNSLYCVIDVDFPSVSSITDPRTLVGFPTTIQVGINSDAQAPNITAATWKIVNVDIFKAGYEYALVKPEIKASANATAFIKISDAAGMMGFSRIIPISGSAANLRNFIQYASKLVKGPMNVSVMMFSATGTAVTGATIDIYFDFVKRRV